MGSRGLRPAPGRRAGIAVAVWVVTFSVLAVATAVAWNLDAKLTVDDCTPYVNQTVHFDASASKGGDGDDGKIVAYKFSFGDGTGTDWQSRPTAAHAYESAGNVTASVTVKDKRGNKDSASVLLTVRTAPPPPAPDLVPVFATIDPSHPTAGDAVNLTAVLLNRGGTATESAEMDVYDRRPNGTVVLLGNVSVTKSVEPGTTYNAPFGPFAATGVGNHTLRVVVTNVSPATTVKEERALNLTMTVFPAIPPPPPPAKYPELTPFVAIIDPAHPTEGDAVNLTVFVLNRGEATATAATVMVFDDGPNGTAFRGSVTLPAALAPSEVEAIAVGPFEAADPGNHTLRIVVNDVTPPETIFVDNMLNLSMTVSAAPLPPPPEKPSEPTFDLGALVIAGLVAAGIASATGAAIYILRPAHPSPLEPPSHIPPDRSPGPIWPP